MREEYELRELKVKRRGPLPGLETGGDGGRTLHAPATICRWWLVQVLKDPRRSSKAEE